MPSRTSLLTRSLALAAGLAPLVVRADLQLDDDVPLACQSICRPVQQLGQTCDVDDDFVRDQTTEYYLNLQCYCLNTSFDVRSITALCASCIQQNPRRDGDRDGDDDDDDDDDDRRGDDDEIRDVSEIMFRCGFTSTSYNPAAQATVANSIVVVATRPTNANQLTTILSTGAGGGVGVFPTPSVGPVTSLRTTTFTTGVGTGLTTGTATVLATAVATPGTTGVSVVGSTSGASGLAGGRVRGWTAMVGYTVGVAAVAAWFF